MLYPCPLDFEAIQLMNLQTKKTKNNSDPKIRINKHKNRKKNEKFKFIPGQVLQDVP